MFLDQIEKEVKEITNSNKSELKNYVEYPSINMNG